MFGFTPEERELKAKMQAWTDIRNQEMNEKLELLYQTGKFEDIIFEAEKFIEDGYSNKKMYYYLDLAYKEREKIENIQLRKNHKPNKILKLIIIFPLLFMLAGVLGLLANKFVPKGSIIITLYHDLFILSYFFSWILLFYYIIKEKMSHIKNQIIFYIQDYFNSKKSIAFAILGPFIGIGYIALAFSLCGLNGCQRIKGYIQVGELSDFMGFHLMGILMVYYGITVLGWIIILIKKLYRKIFG